MIEVNKKDRKDMQESNLNIIYKDIYTDIYNEAKLFLNFNSTDIMRLKRVHPTIKPLLPRIVDAVLERIRTNPKLSNLMKDHSLPIETARSVFIDWLNIIFTSDYDISFVQYAYDIGSVHEKVGIKAKYVTMAMAIFVLAIDFVLNKMVAERELIYSISHSIKKAMFLNLTLMLQSYEDAKRNTIIRNL
ncbi:MAG: protoglobin domain-containing protein [Desulfobacteraceae bacterium]|jgi:hypothetical protein